MTAHSNLPVVAVAGDVCIDWLSIPTEPAPSDGKLNWRLRNGTHMFAVRGGAWLTADLAKAALGRNAQVIPPAPRAQIENVAPGEVIHSLLRLRAFSAVPDDDKQKDKQKVWRVEKFEGFAGPLRGLGTVGTAMQQPVPRADLVLLDDAGNGYRDCADAWPAVLRSGSAKPMILFKCRRPLMSGALWECVQKRHAARTVVILTADDLRSSGATISSGLSWERTAYDTWQALAHSRAFQPLLACKWIVVAYGIEGALLASTQGGKLDTASLWFSPLLSEGDLVRGNDGDMTGLGSAFAAAAAASFVADAALPTPERAHLSTAVKKGLLAARQMLAAGFGPTEKEDKSKMIRPPAFPTGPDAAGTIFAGNDIEGFRLVAVRLPALRAGLSRKEVSKQQHWRIIDQLRTEPMAALAARVLSHGVKKVFADIPRGVFGKFVTVDRAEIESYRSARNLMLEYVRLPRPERPLCLAVFGQPGTGKSFGVTAVASDVAKAVKGASIEKIEFNVSQWESPAQFIQSLHRVRDFAIRGKVPLVFFDEFDSALHGTKLAWLKSFLAPMQDGVFSDGQFSYQLGRAIFVFAGGTAHKFEEFAKAHGEDRDAKAPDFLSRLRGHVDVFGFSPPANTNLIRRAVVLRVALRKKFPGLFDTNETLRIEPAVAAAFLHAPEYRHGARSIEAIVEMSRIVGFRQFESSSLPPELQLDEHVIGSAFLRSLSRQPGLGDELEKIAEAIHEHYLAAQIRCGEKMNSRPALRPWDELDALYQNSNREQASDYVNKLVMIGCEIVPAGAGARLFKFTKEELNLLAEKEHERWIAERQIIEPHHAALVPWAKLKADERKKDIETIKAIPAILKTVCLAIRRVE